jgi:hypothetical protein
VQRSDLGILTVSRACAAGSHHPQGLRLEIGGPAPAPWRRRRGLPPSAESGKPRYARDSREFRYLGQRVLRRRVLSASTNTVRKERIISILAPCVLSRAQIGSFRTKGPRVGRLSIVLIVANAGVGALRFLIATVLMAGHTVRTFKVLLAPLSA